MSAVYVEIAATRGSTPREAGTVMKVTGTGIEGTIGGGALEWEAMRLARRMLAEGTEALERTIPLGPDLGQCCGGSVRLRFSRTGTLRETARLHVHRLEKGPRPHPLHLWVWGAGHVGRAVVAAAHPQSFRITWIDESRARFPERIRDGVTVMPAADMPLLAARAPRHVHHLILTYSHEIDLSLCAALLKRGFASCGLIGSDTKRARFARRLEALGLDPGRIQCPIGDKSLGKHPEAIAEGVIRDLLCEPGKTGVKTA